ncbi:MAG: hypothetical protein JXR70_06680 [Spirochaetales bacterium]|nr:hypothetical protein [Spirochaetales bacterium]
MKKFMLLILVINILGCKELPGPDILTGNIPHNFSITEPKEGMLFYPGDKIEIRWNNQTPIFQKAKISLLCEEKFIEVVQDDLLNSGSFDWKCPDRPMNSHYRFLFVPKDGIYKGKSFYSDTFGVRIPWEDLGTISDENAWGASVCSVSNEEIFVLFQDSEFGLSAHQYKEKKWKNTNLIIADSKNFNNYFSSALSSNNELIAAFTVSTDRAVIKRLKNEPPEPEWEFLPYIAKGQLTLGISLADYDNGKPQVVFSSTPPFDENWNSIKTENSTPLKILNKSSKIDMPNFFGFYLLSRQAINSDWQSELTIDNQFWFEMGEETNYEDFHYNPNFGKAVICLNPHYIQGQLISHNYLHQIILQYLGEPISNNHLDINQIIRDNRKQIQSLQSDFYPSLTIDKQQVSYIAFLDGSYTSKLPYVLKEIKSPSAKDSAPEWELLANDSINKSISKKHSIMISMALDKEEHPVVAFKELSPQEKIVVKVFKNGGWVDLNFPGSAGLSYPSIKSDENGKIYLAAGRSVWTYEANQWEIIGIPVTNGAGFHPEWLSVTTESVCVAYVDFNNNNKIHVKKLTLR